MIADSERRDVARRLRELRSGWSSGECYYTIIHALGLPDTSREDGGAALYARLADLIEPGEPKVKCVAEVKVDGERLESLVHDAAVELTGIDRDALLALAEEMGRVRSRCDFCIKKGDCDWADETICLESRIDDYAQLIREALGADR